MNKFRFILNEQLQQIQIKSITWATLVHYIEKLDKSRDLQKITRKLTSNLDSTFKLVKRTNIDTMYHLNQYPGNTCLISEHKGVQLPAIIINENDKYILTHINEKQMHLTFEKI